MDWLKRLLVILLFGAAIVVGRWYADNNRSLFSHYVERKTETVISEYTELLRAGLADPNLCRHAIRDRYNNLIRRGRAEENEETGVHFLYFSQARMARADYRIYLSDYARIKTSRMNLANFEALPVPKDEKGGPGLRQFLGDLELEFSIHSHHLWQFNYKRAVIPLKLAFHAVTGRLVACELASKPDEGRMSEWRKLLDATGCLATDCGGFFKNSTVLRTIRETNGPGYGECACENEFR